MMEVQALLEILQSVWVDHFREQNLQGTNIAVSPGTFSVSETGPSGYTQSLSGDCSGTINAGDRKVCTITNNDKPQTGDASITVRRVSCTSERSIGLDITVSISHDSQEIPFMLQYYLPSGNLLRVPRYTVPANAPDPFIAGISDVLNLPPGPTAGTYKIIMVVNYDYDNAITTTFQVPECSQAVIIIKDNHTYDTGETTKELAPLPKENLRLTVKPSLPSHGLGLRNQ